MRLRGSSVLINNINTSETSGYKSKRLSILLLTVAILISLSSGAQNEISTSTKENALPVGDHPAPVLFIQTDKTIYTNNETIWFAGYVLSGKGKEWDADVLTVCLIQKETGRIVLQKNYLITDHLCAGSLLLPDTIPPGNYKLAASINVISNSGLLTWFRQDIIIKSVRAQALVTTLTIDTLSGSSPDMNVKVSVRLPDESFAGEATLMYHFANQKAKTIKLDAYGKGAFTVAKKEPTPDNHTLYTLAQYKNKSHPFNLMLPFHLAMPALKQTDTCSGNSMMSISNPVADDTLLVLLQDQTHHSVRLSISNTVSADTSGLIPGGVRTIKIPLSTVSKGLSTLTLLDSSNQPLTKHLFFAHRKQTNTCLIKTDRETYRTRDKVSVIVRIANDTGNRMGGTVTISCVQKGRIDTLAQREITSSYYLNRFTDYVSNSSLRSAYGATAHLVQLLRLSDTKDNTLQEINTPTINDSTFQTRRLAQAGQVYRDKKLIRKPVRLILKFDSAIAMLQTDNNGYFPLPVSDIVVKENRPVYAMVEGSNNYGYEIVAKDEIGQSVAKAILALPVENLVVYTSTQASKDGLLNDSLGKVNALPEVVVKTKEKFYSTAGANNPVNACGDYLCYGGALNCPYHPPRYRPVKGERYYVYHIGLVTYQGCWSEEQQHIFKIDPVYTSRDWYGMDSITLAQAAPEYMSTIYWKPFSAVDKENNLQVSFYTSDLPGTYLITVSGVGDNGEPVSAGKEIHVLKQ